jgi:2-methylisocitrate lyase-like PEP mutase family enzyme
MTGRTDEFRRLHHADEPLFLPNAWDVASAAALAAKGFAAIGTTSLGVAAASGKPDGAAATRAETLDLARRLTGLPCLVSVDLEGGFSDRPAEVAELVRHLAELGVVGANLEDGRPDGSLAAPEEHAGVVAAVRAAAPEIFLNARTDTFWLGSGDLGETVQRAQAYADAGADGIFVPGVARDHDVAALVDAIALPLNVLFLPGTHRLPRLARLGVRRVSCGSLLFRAALGAAVETAVAIGQGGAGPTGAPSYADIQALAW